ncbi:MAG: hypothetical protein WC457_01890 [Patescibacteria group bacterium]
MENNVNPTPSAPVAPSTPTTTPTGGNNNKTALIIAIAAILVIGIGYTAFSRWRADRTAQNMLKNLGIEAGGQMMNNENSGDEGKELTPAEIFANAENQEIGDSTHKAIADEVGGIIKAVYDDYKLSSFVSGYMGMNSGSGIFQYTLPKLVAVSDAGSIAKEMENRGMKIITNIQQNEAASIMAQKDNFTYTIGFNKDEQVITAIVINAEQGNSHQ